MPDTAQEKLVDIYVKDQVNVLRMAAAANRDVAKVFKNLQRSLIALVANEYTPDGGRKNLAMLNDANEIIDSAFDEIKQIAEQNRVDIGELEIDTFVDEVEEVLSGLN